MIEMWAVRNSEYYYSNIRILTIYNLHPRFLVPEMTYNVSSGTLSLYTTTHPRFTDGVYSTILSVIHEPMVEFVLPVSKIMLQMW